VAAALNRALRLADETGIPEHRRGPLMGQWLGAFGDGEYPDARHFAQELMDNSMRSGDDLGAFIAHRMLAQALHFLGDHAAARRHAERVLAQADRTYPFTLSLRPVDVRSSMGLILARIRWLEGDAECAAALAEQALSFAEHDRPIALCHVLGMAVVPIALWRGQDATARRHLDRMAAHAKRHQLRYWSDWAQTFEAVLVERAGGPPAAAPPPTGRKLVDLFVTLVARVPDAEVLARADAGVSGWAAPEVFRAQGDALWRAGGEHAAARAEPWLRRAHALALAQSAPAWALRAATSLGTVLRATARGEEARVLLEAALAALPEGADAEAARALLRP
jgi:ATP/maltotriose-dependent transcriptional regulator MalT